MWQNRSAAGRWLLTATFAVAAILLKVPASAADAVSGYVLDPTTDVAVPDAKVAFLLAGEDGLTEVLRKSTDAEGRFVFSGPFLTPGLRFVLVAFHRDIPYPTAKLELGEQTEVILEVFEPTSESSRIHVGTHHLFLSVHPEHVEVAQLLHLDNGGLRTYVGTGSGAERSVTEFVLPDGLFGLQGHSGQMTQLEQKSRFAHSQPLVPGRTQIAFSFMLDAERFDGVYGHVAPFPTHVLEVYVQPPDTDLGAPFEDLGPTVLHDQSYRRFRVEGLAAGQRLDMTLPLQRSLGWTLKWAALGLALVGCAAVFASSRSASRAGGAIPSVSIELAEVARAAGVDPRADRAQLEQVRRRLLADIAAYGTSARRGHSDEYDERLDRAVALYRLLDALRSGRGVDPGR